MNKITNLILGLVFWMLFLFQSFANIPDSLIIGANDLIISEKIEFNVTSVGKASYRYYLKANILNEKSHNATVYILHNSYINAKWISGFIYDKNGKLVRKIKAKDLQDVASNDGFSVFTDSRYKIVELNYNKYPYTIEYTYEKEYSELMYYPGWIIQGFNQGVLNAEFTLRLPTNLETETKVSNLNLNPTIEVVDDQKVYRWQVSNLKPIDKEKGDGQDVYDLPQLDLAPHTFEGKTWAGSMKDWNSFGKFLYDLNKDREELSPEMKAEVAILIKDCKTDNEKIQVLYKYLQSNYRYVSVQVGIGGWQAFDAKYVEQNKYGDCKALSNFMRGMLKSAEVNSNLIVISNGQIVTIDSNFVDPMFNHMILHIPEEDIFLECTSHDYPPGYVGWNNANRTVLSISKEGGELIEMPKLSSEDNRLERNDTLSWSKTGQAILKGKLIAFNSQHEKFRYISNRFDQNKEKTFFLQNYAQSIEKINFLQFYSEENAPEAGYSYNVILSKIGSKSGSRMFIPAVPVETFENPFQNKQTNLNQIKRDKSFSDETFFIIEIPENYDLESLPKDYSISDEVIGDYSIFFEKKESSIIVHRTLNLHAITIKSNEYEKVYDFYQGIEKNDRVQFVLKSLPNKS